MTILIQGVNYPRVLLHPCSSRRMLFVQHQGGKVAFPGVSLIEMAI
jgi:hypothetical protein